MGEVIKQTKPMGGGGWVGGGVYGGGVGGGGIYTHKNAHFSQITHSYSYCQDIEFFCL